MQTQLVFRTNCSYLFKACFVPVEVVELAVVVDEVVACKDIAAVAAAALLGPLRLDRC